MGNVMKIFSLLICSLCLLGCSEEEIALSDSFFKIYDDENFSLDYNPIDMVETVDGFIILSGTELSASDFMGVQLIKVDEEGNFESEASLPNYVVPVGDIHLIDSIVYFFVMNPVSLGAILVGINSELDVVLETQAGGLNYPLASSITANNELILLSYDPLNLTTEISLIGTDGSILGGNSYSIGPGSDVEEDIINHYLNVGQPLSFFCGEFATGKYYFNGFFNFSLSLVFTDFSDTPSGVVQGQSTNAGIRAIQPIAGSNFAVAGYQFSENFQLPSILLNTTGITSSVDLFPGDMAELKAHTPAKIVSYETPTSLYTVFASESNGNQILLYFYENSTGEIAGIKQLGFLNPYTFSSIKVGEDNSILVLGTTFVAGRFERIALTKLSEREIRGLL